MTTASFDIHIRTLECKRCGAPVATDQRGGEITCRYCGTVNVLPTRRAAAGAGVVRSLADEVARLSRLQAQLVNPISAHAYDMDQLREALHALLPAPQHRDSFLEERSEAR